MGTKERRLRERTAQRDLITATARALAEREGWDAVTTRRLSTEIEYSQPVLYKHFDSMDHIIEAVALEGFGELATALGDARRGGPPEQALGRVAQAYGVFATENPVLYEAMFNRATRLRFGGGPESPTGFAELREAVEPIADGRDAGTLTEVFWAALHGLITLSRANRLRPGLDSERIELLVSQFQDAAAGRRTG